MFGLERLFKRKHKKQNMKVINERISRNQESVFKAVKEIGYPASGRSVAAYLGWDSASVTNRLSELHKKERIRIAYRKQGLDKIWRNYYVVKEAV